MSPIPNFDQEDSPVKTIDSNLNLDKTEVKSKMIEKEETLSMCLSDNKTIETMEGKCMDDLTISESKNYINDNDVDKIIEPTVERKEYNESTATEINSKDLASPNESVHRVHSVNTISFGMGELGNSLPRDTSSDALSDARVTSNITQIAHVNPELCGLPLGLFSKVRQCSRQEFSLDTISTYCVSFPGLLVSPIPVFTISRLVGRCQCQGLHCGSNKRSVQAKEAVD